MTTAIVMGICACLLAFPVAAAAPIAAAELAEGLDAAYRGKFDQAYPRINRYIEANPRDAEGYMVRGTTGEWEQKLRNLKGSKTKAIIDDFEKANQLAFQAFDRDPDQIEHLVALGNSYLRLGKKWGDEGKWMRAALISKKSRRHLERAIHMDPERWDAYMSLGAFHYFSANLPAGAKPFASLLGIKGDRALGIQEVTQATTHPNLYQPDALYLLKYIYRKENNHSKVLDLLRDLYKTYPENAEIGYDIAVAYRDLKAYPKALSHLQTFLKDCPIQERQAKLCHDRYRYQGYALLGRIHHEMKQFQEAASAMERALAIDAYPNQADYAQLHYELGEVYMALGDRSKAKMAYETVVALPFKDAKEWRERAEVKLQTL